VTPASAAPHPPLVERNASDPLPSRLGPGARETSIAERSEDGYVLDIHVQGTDATQFFRL
jgi:hypothetical protein